MHLLFFVLLFMNSYLIDAVVLASSQDIELISFATHGQVAAEAIRHSRLSRRSRRASYRNCYSSHMSIPHRKVIIHVLVSVPHGTFFYQDCLTRKLIYPLTHLSTRFRYRYDIEILVPGLFLLLPVTVTYDHYYCILLPRHLHTSAHATLYHTHSLHPSSPSSLSSSLLYFTRTSTDCYHHRSHSTRSFASIRSLFAHTVLLVASSLALHIYIQLPFRIIRPCNLHTHLAYT